MGRDITAMSNSDEPNFLIYNMIKEMDYLVESNQQQQQNSSLSDNASMRQPQNQTVNDQDSSHNRSILSQNLTFGSPLPTKLVFDYNEVLKIAIEIFQNNFSP